ncbi:glycoside hydrolase family 15 protein [Nonomuraea sp. NPDC049504]|uniref:glycoside hydrolase family 15 protein n=1 Tax=Nonomuraea sp. NPDC049504 TaxID=3154729 RepID=UPI0034494A2A
MPLPIEDYALIGDTQTAALVGLDGSIDWLCLPRFDSGACFAALLGEPANGRWLIAPTDAQSRQVHRYRDDTLVLETEFTTGTGVARVVDCMPIRHGPIVVIRRVEGVRGSVPMRLELLPRLDYGHIPPLIRSHDRVVTMEAGPDTLTLHADVDLQISDAHVTAGFCIGAGESAGFQLSWTDLGQQPQRLPDLAGTVQETTRWWQDWTAGCAYQGRYRDAIVRSLITLKALTYAPSGGIIAAPTTSLPEALGGVRNWDYRFCWIRDATFTLLALLQAGYVSEAVAWREWLLRAVAGRPQDMQIMYGVAGERRLTELQLPWLCGYHDSRPVRIANAAGGQFQLDVYGELMDALHQARCSGIEPDKAAWDVQLALMDFLESNWRQPDEGIWEVRGPRRHFTHSKVMAWVAVDRAIKATQSFGLPGPAGRWQGLRQAIFDDVCANGYNPDKGVFTQSYGSPELDASLLLMAPVGFLPAKDERILRTVQAIAAELTSEGLVHRYTTTGPAIIDGLPAGPEGAFIACTLWLADNYVLQGQHEHGRRLLEKVLALRSDVGLLAEQYDTAARRMVGNFPQALSHLALINAAFGLTRAKGPSRQRAEGGGQPPHG